MERPKKTREDLQKEIKDLRAQIASQRQEAEKEIESTVRDMEEAIRHANRMSVEAEVMAAEMNTVFNASSNGLCVIDMEKRVTRINDAFSLMIGVKQDEVKGKLCHDLLKNSLCQTELCPLEHVKRTGSVVEREIKIDGLGVQGRFYIVTGNPLYGLSGELVGVVESYKDITERKEMELELKRLATIDALTGAYNRRYFMKLAEKDLTRFRRYSFPLSLIMFDLDNFKRINDTYGHGVGDLVLGKTGELTRQHLRESDFLGRLGGEEFGIVLVECDLAGAEEVAQRLRESFQATSFEQDGKNIIFTASFGVAELGNGEDLSQLMARADRALYEAKNTGRNRVSLADPLE
jgi:diguanylate cyclase (GGDEF)-like protein/PAS domain S-box-containing protein